MLIVHDPQCADYGSSLRPEQPARVIRSAAHLRSTHDDWEWVVPDVASDELLLLAHTSSHLKRLHQPHDFDSDTPYLPSIQDHARRAVAAAVLAAERTRSSGEPVFSLMRPPGHHATSSQAMGFCYLNSIATAALHAQRNLGAKRVAIWDFDAHHGNGSEAILRGREGTLFTSVHQSPGYPGTGTSSFENCLNWPVPPQIPAARHMKALRESLDRVIDFGPDLILVSAGFDAYVGDPITSMTLEMRHFQILGEWLRQVRTPTAAILEGGYSPDLPLLIDAFLSAWNK